MMSPPAWPHPFTDFQEAQSWWTASWSVISSGLYPTPTTSRPAYGAIYAVPATAVSRLIGATPGPPVVLAAMERSNARHANRMLALWKGWRNAGVGGGPLAIAAAQGLIAHGRSDEALEVFKIADEGLRTEQLRALALARRGSIRQSNRGAHTAPRAQSARR